MAATDLHARVDEALASVPDEDGCIVVRWRGWGEGTELLATRKAREPVVEHGCKLIVLDGPQRDGLLSMPDPYPEGPRVLWRGEDPGNAGVRKGAG